MREKLESRREKDMKVRDESYRQDRLKAREMVRHLEQTNMDLCEARADKDELAKAVTKGIVRVDGRHRRKEEDLYLLSRIKACPHCARTCQQTRIW